MQRNKMEVKEENRIKEGQGECKNEKTNSTAQKLLKHYLGCKLSISISINELGGLFLDLKPIDGDVTQIIQRLQTKNRNIVK